MVIFLGGCSKYKKYLTYIYIVFVSLKIFKWMLVFASQKKLGFSLLTKTCDFGKYQEDEINNFLSLLHQKKDVFSKP